MKRNKGITLIALVVTIVVLLILAGISISMLGGENGIITKAQEAKEENRGGTVEERRDLWKANQKSDESTNSNTAQTLDELLADLENEGLLTSEEVAIIKDVGVITIGSHVIDFGLEDNIDLSKLKPGLYRTDTDVLTKSWNELKEDGDIIVQGTSLNKIDGTLQGDLVISDEITILCDEDFNGLLGRPCMIQKDAQITKVFIPPTVNKISSYTFYRFSNMTKIIISNNIDSIGNSVFSECSSLTSIEIPSGVTNIGDNAFYNCSSLTNIEIPSGVTNIGDNAFYNCSSLTSIEIPSSVTNIGDYAFVGCSSLANIEILSNITSIGESVFVGCSNLKSVKIPQNVESIGGYAFYYCIGLTSIEIPSSVTSIESSAFENCSSLTTVNYTGTKAEWNILLSSISDGNDKLINAKIICTDGEIN